MEVGQGSAGFQPAIATPAATEQPRRVDDQATRRAVSKADEAEAEREKRERDAAEKRAADKGGVDIRA